MLHTFVLLERQVFGVIQMMSLDLLLYLKIRSSHELNKISQEFQRQESSSRTVANSNNLLTESFFRTQELFSSEHSTIHFK